MGDDSRESSFSAAGPRLVSFYLYSVSQEGFGSRGCFFVLRGHPSPFSFSPMDQLDRIPKMKGKALLFLWSAASCAQGNLGTICVRIAQGRFWDYLTRISLVRVYHRRYDPMSTNEISIRLRCDREIGEYAQYLRTPIESLQASMRCEVMSYVPGARAGGSDR